MRDINIVIDSQTHKVQFPDNFLGLNAENLQGTINFTFKNGFVGGIARLELAYDSQQGYIPNLEQVGESYTLPILSSLLTTDEIVMQLVIDQTDLTTYKLTTDTQINHQKTYYTRSGVEGEYVYTIVEHPNVADIDTYYEAQTPIFKTEIFLMTVGESINAIGTIPDEYPSWIDTLNSLVGQVNAKIIEMNQALAEVDNLDITATKSGTTATITITRKDGSQQVVEIEDGKDGVGIKSITKTGTSGIVDTYTITYTDDSTTTFQVTNGRGIVSIEKTGTNILTDTYTITYNDDTTSTFTIVNGNGIDNIVKIGTSGLIDTYRISYTNGEYYDYELTNGNGIDRIEKTGTVDNVDTYTIYYTNGTTSTYTVTNSTVTNQEFEKLQDRVEYLGKYSNALIKNTDTGASLTINDTANCPMPISLGANTEQATTTGKNLFDSLVLLNVSNWANDGTYYYGASLPLHNYLESNPDIIEFEENTQYTLSFIGRVSTAAGGNRFGFMYTDGTTSYAYINNVTDTELTITSTSGKTVQRLSSTYNSTRTLYLKNIQLEKGIVATNFEEYTGGIASPNPDYPQDIHTISGDNNVYINTKNLGYEGWAEDFVNRVNDTTKAKLETVDNRNCLFYNASVGYREYDTKYIFKTNFKENTRYTFKFMVKVSTNYQINLAFNYTDGTYEQISYNQVANVWNTALFTSASGKTIKYLRAAYYSGNCYIDLDTFQVEEGTTVGDYEKGYQQLLPLTLGTLEYCKIGNYADEFYKATESDTSLVAGKWYLKKNIGKVVLDGSEQNWTYSSSSKYKFRIGITNGAFYINNSTLPILKTNYYNPITWTNSSTPNYCVTSGEASKIAFKNDDMADLTAFQTWLSTHNTIVYYAIATPTYTLLNDTLQEQLENIYNWLLSYKDQTNISQTNDDLPFIITATTVYDLNKLLTRVETLESEV